MPGEKTRSTIQLVIPWIALAILVIGVGCIAVVTLFGKSTASTPAMTTTAPAFVLVPTTASSTPPTSSAQTPLAAWIRATDQGSLQNALDADLRSVSAAVTAKSMGNLAVACNKLASSVAAVEGTLPAPDDALNRALVSMTEHYGKAATICVQASATADTSGLLGFATEFSLGNSAEATALARLKALNGAPS